MVTDKTRAQRVVQAGLAAGAIGGLIMLLAQAIARLAARVPMFPDLFEDVATRAIPAPLFSLVLDTLKFQAKDLLFVSLLLLQIVVGAVIGLVFASIWGQGPDAQRRRWPGWNVGLLGSLCLWLITGTILLPIAGQGVFGANTAAGAGGIAISLLVSFLLFGLTTVSSYRVIAAELEAGDAGHYATTTDQTVVNPERRRLLGGVAVGAVAVLAVGAAYRILTEPIGGAASSGSAATGSGVPSTSVPTIAAASATTTASSMAAAANGAPTTSATLASPVASADWQIKGLAPEVTPTKDFYSVSKNLFSDPVVDPKGWTLQITGLVGKPYSITYDQLLKLPVIQRYETLQCISNEVGGNLISNASWFGVSLRDLIVSAEPDSKAVKVVFTAADGYQDSIPLSRALSAENVLAHTMNGEPLIAGHGMPARLLIPGIYGMKNVKWLTKVELVNNNFQGYWQERGWSDDASINTMSRIDAPDSSSANVKAGKIELAGIAFGGDKGISKVEISLDGAKTWQPAILKDPLDKFTWRLWRYDWNATAGDYQIVVRATNGAGVLQTEQQADTLPNGATGWHSIAVHVG